MATDHKIPELDSKGLREFGLTTGAVVVWPWMIAAPFWALALVQPMWLRWIYRGWMRFGLLASRVMTPLVLGIVFFGMILPIALVWRLMGNDPMRRSSDPNQKSYRVPSTESPKEKLEKPF